MGQKNSLLLGFFSIIFPALLWAEAPLIELKHGMSFYDVLKSLGTPQEKLEREAQREEVWIYANRKIIFQEGKVVAWSDGTSPKHAPQQPSTALADAKVQSDPKQVESLLGEILSDLNSKQEAPPPAPIEPKKDD